MAGMHAATCMRCFKNFSGPGFSIGDCPHCGESPIPQFMLDEWNKRFKDEWDKYGIGNVSECSNLSAPVTRGPVVYDGLDAMGLPYNRD